MIVKSILIGEDIRQELGNKISLMGIFGGSLNINVPPQVPKEATVLVQLAFLVIIENTEPGNNANYFSINVSISLDGTIISDLKVKIDSIVVDQIVLLPIPRTNIPITKSSLLSVYAQIFKGETLHSESTATLNLNFDNAPQT